MQKSFPRKASVLLLQNYRVSGRRAAENAEQVSQECQNRGKSRAKEGKFAQSLSLGPLWVI